MARALIKPITFANEPGELSMSTSSLGRRSICRALLLCSLLGPLLPSTSLAQARAGLPDFTDLVERVGPSVVNIRTLERGRGATGPDRGGVDPNLEEFFRRFGIPLPGGRGGPPRGGDEEPQQRGVGSGFILSSDGYVMTNAHVVDGADEVLVTLTDKREYRARPIGADKRTDVAVVKIEATDLPAVRIGDVGRLKVGEWVMAIGSPFGLANSVTAGIVSAKGRETGDYLPFIQTDVAINPGNSGGPLINMRGEVRGRIGVTIAPVTKEVAESIGLGRPMGAMVRGAEAGGPAEKAGIEAGDIITKVDGKAIESSADLPRLIGGIKPGSRTTVQVFRRGSYRDMSVTVAEFEAEQPARIAQGDGGSNPAAKSALGLAVSELGDAQRRELKIRGGVRVDAVDGAAARAGLREGDVILTLDNTEITDVKQFLAVAAKAEKSRAVSVMVRRGEWVNYLVIRPGR
jgi:serine protease Do